MKKVLRSLEKQLRSPDAFEAGRFAIGEHEPEHAEAPETAEGIGVTAHTEHDQFGFPLQRLYSVNHGLQLVA